MIRREGDPLWALPGKRKGLDVGAIDVVDEPHDVPAHVGYGDEVTILDLAARFERERSEPIGRPPSLDPSA